jgi:probable rRNA maturation factor
VLNLEFSNRQSSLPPDLHGWGPILRDLFEAEGIRHGDVSISIVHDSEMHVLNRQYLNHDYPTDVLSFVFERTADTVDGEIVVSADMALARCGEFGWGPSVELTLYLIHGALHLVGYDDKSPADRQAIRQREAHYLACLGVVHVDEIHTVATDKPTP